MMTISTWHLRVARSHLDSVLLDPIIHIAIIEPSSVMAYPTLSLASWSFSVMLVSTHQHIAKANGVSSGSSHGREFSGGIYGLPLSTHLSTSASAV